MRCSRIGFHQRYTSRGIRRISRVQYAVFTNANTPSNFFFGNIQILILKNCKSKSFEKRFQGMSIEQLSHLSLSAINSLTYAQRSSLDRQQIEAIKGTVKTLGSVLNNSNFTCCTDWLMVTLMTIVLLDDKFAICMHILSSMFSTCRTVARRDGERGPRPERTQKLRY